MACVVCASNPAPFYQERAVNNWPMVEVEGREVHRLCRSEAERAIVEAKTGMNVNAAGEATWKTSGNVPFEDILLIMQAFGYAGDVDLAATAALREQQAEKAIAAYKAMRAEYGYSDVEHSEMRAAFGNSEVVDLFTGQTIQL